MVIFTAVQSSKPFVYDREKREDRPAVDFVGAVSITGAVQGEYVERGLR